MKYEVHWVKRYYSTGVFVVEADSKLRAEEKGDEFIGDQEGSMQYDPGGNEIEIYYPEGSREDEIEQPLAARANARLIAAAPDEPIGRLFERTFTFPW